MSGRMVLAVALVAGVALNTWSGVAKVIGFHHLHEGELALSRAELDSAYRHLSLARGWQPGDAPIYVLLGSVIHHAQANGLPLEALEGHKPLDTFGVGLAVVTHGISLNPADAWGWFNLVDVYQGFRSARVRYASMKRAGEAAIGNRAAQAPESADAPPVGLDPEDRVSVAAALEALDHEPEFYFYHDYLAKLYWDRGLQAEAAREIRESLKQWPRPEVHPALENEGLVRGLADSILSGIDAASLNPFAGPVLAAQARAAMLERLGRDEEAIAAYESLRRVGDRTISSFCDLSVGKLQVQRGRYRDSLPVLSRVVENAAKSPEAVLALYYMGLAHAGLGEHRKAAELLRRHLEAAPQSLSGYLALAEEEETVGRSDEAERLYIAAVVKFPTEPLTYLKVIEQMRKHGKAGKAMSYAEALRKVSPDRDGAQRLIDELKSEAGPKLP